MKQATPSASAAFRALLAAVIALVVVISPRQIMAQGTPPAAPGFGALQGFVVDSIHSQPLVKARVTIVGTDRSTLTDENGHYRIDSIPPGNHAVLLQHPILDTLGLNPWQTRAFPFVANEAHDLDVPIPGSDRIASAVCSADPMRMRGPGAMVGFVRDPDTRAPAIGSSVELVYYEPDLIGRKQLRTRTGKVDSTGMYRICGLPKDMTGKVQVFRNGVSSGEVPAEASGLLTVRAFSVASSQRVVEVKGDSGKMKRIAKGTARVTGRVYDTKGQPLREARVALQGGGEVTLTKPNGEFTLDSLPSGTQALEVRKLGYSVTEVPVELAANTTASTTVKMSDAVPLLATMRVEAQADDALSKLGYLSRKQTGMGYFFDGKQINHEALMFSDVMRISPGLRVQPTGDGRTQVITDSRNASSGCVNFRVDGQPWTSMTPGDIDDYVQPADVVAVEVYHGSETPPEFQQAGQTSCATVVVWTRAKTSTMQHDKKK